jgi:hypothetical protein
VAKREVPQARDAIPRNAILLTDAYEQLVELIIDHPERLPEFDETWSEALKESRELEQSAMTLKPSTQIWRSIGISERKPIFLTARARGA